MIIPSVSDTDFLLNGYSITQLGSLENLGAIKTLSFDDYSGHRVKSIGVYDEFLILPNKLFLHQNVINVTENISEKLNAEIRFSITNDLENYYVYQNYVFKKIDNLRNGMSLNQLNNIDFTSWSGDLGIAISIQELSIDKEIEVDDLFVSANKSIELMAHGNYKINYGTLIETEVGKLNITTINNIDSMFS